MKKRYLDGSDIDPNWLLGHSSEVIKVKDYYEGHVGMINVHKVKYPIPVDYEGEDVLVDNDHKCVMYLPKDKTWCASAYYNSNNDIIEWYFDMTKHNRLDEEGRPYYLDLYLDIVVDSKGTLTVLDEDELLEALEQGIISEEDVKQAKSTCDDLQKNWISNKEFMVDFFNRHLLMITGELNGN